MRVSKEKCKSYDNIEIMLWCQGTTTGQLMLHMLLFSHAQLAKKKQYQEAHVHVC